MRYILKLGPGIWNPRPQDPGFQTRGIPGSRDQTNLDSGPQELETRASGQGGKEHGTSEPQKPGIPDQDTGAQDSGPQNSLIRDPWTTRFQVPVIM